MTNRTIVSSAERFRAELVTFVGRRVESPEVAEDIVQDVFERLQRASSASISNPKAWLYRAARNATIDHYRTRRNHARLDTIEEPTLEIDGEWPNPTTRELARCLRPLLTQLPTKYQRAVTLVDLEGHTHREAAEMEQTSVSGMKSRVQRGRRQLAQQLTECCELITDSGGRVVDHILPPDRGCP